MLSKRGRFFKKRVGKKPLKKQVNKLKKQVGALTKRNLKIRTSWIQRTGLAAVWPGHNPGTYSMGNFFNTMLSGVSQGDDSNQRSDSLIYPTALFGSIKLRLPNTAVYANGGVNWYRVIIVRIEDVPNDGANPPTGRDPFIGELIASTNPTTVEMMYNPTANYEKVMGRKANYTIVWEARGALVLAGSAPNIGACAVHRFNIKGMKHYHPCTFSGSTDVVADALKNHYFLYCFCETIPANNVPEVDCQFSFAFEE